MKQKLFLMLFALVLSATAVAQETIFPTKFTAPAEFNTGKVHISVLSRSEHQMTTNFLFERGSRNSWHYHPGATQVLMVLSGEAYYQEEGKPKQLLRKGDVVTTAPNVRHWNGATPWSDCECMTVSDIVPGEEHAVQLKKVTDSSQDLVLIFGPLYHVFSEEDKVAINGHEVADQAELRQYVEDYNSDSRTFTLEEEQSILETYNWVKAVFDELDIQLKNSR